MKPVVFHPAADAEYAAAAAWYAEQGAGLGGRFYEEIERLVAEVAAGPKQFWMFDPPARRNVARRFPYAVVFVEEPDRIWIVAVMSLRRHPDYWKDRLA